MGNSWCRYIFNNEPLLCIVDYYSKFPVMKRADGLSADDLIKASEIMFVKFGIPKRKSIRCKYKLHAN